MQHNSDKFKMTPRGCPPLGVISCQGDRCGRCGVPGQSVLLNNIDDDTDDEKEREENQVEGKDDQ